MKILLNLFLGILLISPLDAQELSSILEAHYKGAAQQKLQKVQSIITTGKSTYTMSSFESAYKIYQSRPDKIRVEGDYQNAKVIQTYNGEKAWKYAPAMGIPAPAEMKGDEMETFLSQLQFENPLWNYAETGAELELGESGNDQIILLRYTDAEGEVKLFGIDVNTNLITFIKTTQVLGGSESEIEVTMEAYKSVKGIPFAHRVITSMNGQQVTIQKIEKIEINKKIDPSLFEKPIPAE